MGIIFLHLSENLKQSTMHVSVLKEKKKQRKDTISKVCSDSFSSVHVHY